MTSVYLQQYNELELLRGDCKALKSAAFAYQQIYYDPNLTQPQRELALNYVAARIVAYAQDIINMYRIEEVNVNVTG